MNAKIKETLLNPIFKGNPITVLVLGICSSLAVTVTLKGALVMSLSVIVVTGVSSLILSILRNTIPSRVRIIVQLVVVAMMVILVDQVLKSFEATYKRHALRIRRPWPFRLCDQQPGDPPAFRAHPPRMHRVAAEIHPERPSREITTPCHYGISKLIRKVNLR